MTHDEFMDLDPQSAADKLNELIDAGKTPAEAEAEFGLTKPDMLKLNVFAVKGRYMGRAWGGYTSTKRTGNEGASEIGIGGSFKDIKPE